MHCQAQVLGVDAILIPAPHSLKHFEKAMYSASRPSPFVILYADVRTQTTDAQYKISDWV